MQNVTYLLVEYIANFELVKSSLYCRIKLIRIRLMMGNHYVYHNKLNHHLPSYLNRTTICVRLLCTICRSKAVSSEWNKRFSTFTIKWSNLTKKTYIWIELVTTVMNTLSFEIVFGMNIDITVFVCKGKKNILFFWCFMYSLSLYSGPINVEFPVFEFKSVSINHFPTQVTWPRVS